MNDRNSWRIDRLEDKHDKIREEVCKIEERVRVVERKEVEHDKRIDHIKDVLDRLPGQIQDSITRLEDRLAEPLTRYEKAKWGITATMVGVFLGWLLN